MNLVQKAFLFYKKEGIKNTICRTGEKVLEIIARIPSVLKEKLFQKKYIRQVENNAAGKKIYVIIPCIDWNIPIFQRPHQIALALARRPNSHVFFVSDQYKYDRFPGILSVEENLDLLSWRIVRQVGPALKSAEHLTVLMTWPRQVDLLNYIPFDKFIYEYVDDLSLFYYYTNEMKAVHYDLIRKADLTVCTSRCLYDDACTFSDKVLLSPNACDYAFFHENRNCPIEPRLHEIVKDYRCVLGYYGSLASWFDYDLIIEIAQRKKNWCFVIVGYCFDGTVSKIRDAALDNIILFDAQPYEKIPAFASSFDIQIIPFIVNEITKATSPVKLFEYMAMGRPILTSAMPECLRYKSVITYSDAEDFISKAKELLAIREDDPYFEVMNEEARANTWDSRVKDILELEMGEYSAVPV